MSYHLRDDFSGKKGTISNLNGFMYRDLDTGFSSKWSGYWNPPYKYLDYLAVKVNGAWLDGNSLEGVDYSDDRMIFYHETESLTVKEIVETPEELSGFRLELEIENKTDETKAVLTHIELGIDIRRRDRDVEESEYHLKRNNKQLMIENKVSKTTVESQDEFEISGGSYTKEHFPGERQICFVPGNLVYKKEVEGYSSRSISLEMTTGEASTQELEDLEPEIEDHEIARLFNSSTSSMRKLVYDENGLGIIAGHPWFQNFWGRDMFWTLLGYIDAGYFESAHEMLENYAEQEGFPTRIKEDSRDDQQGADEPALFILAAEKLRRHWQVSDRIEEKIREGLIKIETDENGIINNRADGTWMDTLEREKAVEIQSLTLEACRRTGSDKKKDLKKGMEKFLTDKYLKDTHEDTTKTINPAIPLMFRQIGKKHADDSLEIINAEFNSRYGARTRSMTEPGYESSGYHTGSVWGLTTGWAAAANLANGKTGQGINFLKKMNQYLDRNQLGGLPEVVDAESGELLGCGEQAWSAGLMVHVIDSYLLGMTVEDGVLHVEPSGEFTCVRRSKRVGEETVDLKFIDGEVEILNNTGVDVEVES